MAVERNDQEERQAVMRALDLLPIAPAIDRTESSIARRTGLARERVSEILGHLAVEQPHAVREVGAGQWLRNPMIRRSCDPGPGR